MSITKCRGFGCPFEANCERVDVGEMKQGETWFKGVPFKDDEGLIECNHFVDKNNLAVKLMERLRNGSDGSVTA